MRRLTTPAKIFILIVLLLMVAYIILTILMSMYVRSFHFDINKYKNNYLLYRNTTREYNVPYNLLPETDYNALINIKFNFTKISFPCLDGAAPLLLILVHSSPRNSAKRKTIRETWGRNQDDIKVLFFLGSVTSEELQQNLTKENSIHKDLIQGSFLDSYKNLTYKHTMVLKYAVYHCPATKYILKTDDDIFVNTPTLINFLRKDLSPYGAENVLICPVVYKAGTFRSFRSKWRISFDEYPYRRYPTYCLGWVVLYSPDLVFSFYREIQRSNYFWIDDVYVTGIIAEKIKFVDHTNIFPLSLSSREVRSLIDGRWKFRPFLFGTADMEENAIRNIWKYVTNSAIPQSIEEALKNQR